MTRKSKKDGILLVANWPSDVGYAWWLMESYWAAIASSFESTHDSYLVFPELNKLPRVIEQSPITPIEYKFEVSSWSDIKRNCDFIKQHNIRVIYLSDYGVSSFAYLCYRIAGVKYIITHDHTPGLRTEAKGIRKLLKYIRANFPGISVDAAFGATSFVTRRLQKTNCLNANKCFTVQNGIQMHEKPEDWQLPDWFPQDGKFTIITAARANKYKGILFALDVVSELIQNGHQNIRYIFCGDGPHLEEFIARAKELDIDDNCLFPGRVNEVWNLFPYCSIGFQPSQGEVGYSLSVIEYMAAGLPVIVPDNPSVCDATEHSKTGRIYKDLDIQDAVQQISFYIQSNSELASNAESAREVVADKFTLTNSHSSLINGFMKVIKNNDN